MRRMDKEKYKRKIVEMGNPKIELNTEIPHQGDIPNPTARSDPPTAPSSITPSDAVAKSTRFNAPVNHILKKIRRAERFGIPVHLTEQEKRNSRSWRFGISVPSTASDEEAKKKARLERFGSIPKANTTEEEKRKSRAIRFANQQSSSSAKINGNGDVVPVIASKASGGT